jgi:hypothetical protein
VALANRRLGEFLRTRGFDAAIFSLFVFSFLGKNILRKAFGLFNYWQKILTKIK